MRLLFPLICLSTAHAVTRNYAERGLEVGVTPPAASSCLEDQAPAVEEEIEMQDDERDLLLLAGERYNLPPFPPIRSSSIPSNWIVNNVPGDDDDEGHKDSTFVKIEDCLSNSELKQILSMRSMLKAEWMLNDDRHREVEYYHIAHRVEPILKDKYPNVYESLIGKMLAVDTDLWRITESVNKVYPVIEFVEQTIQTAAMDDAQVDHGSVLTAFFMLSDTVAYKGGSLNFVENHAQLNHNNGSGRPANFEIRECALFRGDQLPYLVTPVTHGTRIMLKVQLHLSFFEDELDDEEDYEDEEDNDQEKIEIGLELIGEKYNLPLRTEERGDASMDQSKWIINGLNKDEPGRASTFVKVSDCLSSSEWDDILSIQSLLKPEMLIHDRDDETDFYHVVHRVERILKDQFSDSGLYETLIDKMVSVDSENWNVLGQLTKVYPEMEFIQYNQTLEGQPPKMGFASHVDNGSVLTAVFMLSDSADYEGGSLTFARDFDSDIEDGGGRPADFTVRECAIFRGDELPHWVTPVTRGNRKVLQIELHLSLGDRGPDDDDD